MTDKPLPNIKDWEIGVPRLIVIDEGDKVKLFSENQVRGCLFIRDTQWKARLLQAKKEYCFFHGCENRTEFDVKNGIKCGLCYATDELLAELKECK